MKKNLLLGALIALGTALAAHAQPLTIANFGGANGKAQEVAFIQPFKRASKADARGVEYPGDLAAIRAMVSAGKNEWDVVEVESADLKAGCEAGLFERVERAGIPHANMLLPGTVQDCGVGAFVWSTVMAYDPARFKETPRTWKDFWDVQRFPGKRGLRKGARYNLEIALMADGVHRREVYAMLATQAGVGRALAKLAQLKPNIIWWDAGNQPPQRLASGETVMSSAYNGRIAAANRERTAPLVISWVDAVYDLDYWVIIKGSPRRDLARAFISFATTDEAQLAFSREIPYGPTHFNAILRYDTGATRPVTSTPVTDLSMAGSDLPSAPGNLRRSLAFDAAFWTRNSAELEKQYAQRMN
ncbi:MAG: ABC transporter substrate-binding protein [Pseudomonadota bacterium]|nr:ABC transporter substrate-binding protein [Pseudomonadota bacterium]